MHQAGLLAYFAVLRLPTPKNSGHFNTLEEYSYGNSPGFLPGSLLIQTNQCFRTKMHCKCKVISVYNKQWIWNFKKEKERTNTERHL